MILDALFYYIYINLFYYLIGGITFMVDYYNIFIEKKIQIDKINNIMPTYTKIMPQVLLNTFIYLIPFCIYGGIYDANYEDAFSVKKCVIDLLISIPLIDIFFYVCHKMFHTKFLYQYHKKHHEIIAPVGISALYMSPLDLYLGNIIPSILPAYLLHYHPITVKILIFVAIINTIAAAHSGFKRISEFHDYHHSMFNYNFGIDIFMDRLFGTYWA